MRMSPNIGGGTKQLSLEVRTADHKRLREYAKREGRSVNEILRQWIMPLIKKLPEDEE